MKSSRFIIFVFILMLVISGCKGKEDSSFDNEFENEVVKKVSIVDLDSNTRPYAVVINNFPKAVKVQSGLQEAYMIYEFPIEGGISRMLALYKDKSDVKIGTVRSARHDYLDYVLENDAIFVHFGMNVPAERDIIKLDIDYIDGNTKDPSVFVRENPERLAREHTVYTNLSNVIDYNKNKKNYRETTNVKPPLNYVVDEFFLDKYDDAVVAGEAELVYSNSFKVNFKYNNETKRYDRIVNDVNHIDYFTKKQYDCKNILVLLIDYGFVSEHADMAGNNYLDLYNEGTGKGYYITNGYAREIVWNKKDRKSQTKYTYLDGSEVDINDGNTWIMFNSKKNGVKFS